MKLTNYTWTVLIAATAQAQAALILPIVGNIRLMDIFLFVLTLYKLMQLNFKIKNIENISLIILFLILPLVILTGVYLSEISTGTSRFSAAKIEDIRYSPAISALQAVIFGMLCISLVIGNKLTTLQLRRINQVYIYSTVIVLIYAIYAMIGVGQLGWSDLVPNILDRRNSQPEEMMWRMIGLSNEPGSFAYLTSAALLSTIHSGAVEGKKRNAIIILLAIGNLFTFSGPAFLFWTVYGINYLFKLKKRIFSVVLLIIVISVILLNINSLNDQVISFLIYMFYERLTEFLSALMGNTTNDYSGSQRAATFLYGIFILKYSYFMGTGPGLSIFVYDQVKDQIQLESKIINDYIFPQNIYTFTAAEYGLMGVICLVIFIIGGFLRKSEHGAYVKWIYVLFVIFGLALAPVYATLIFFPFLLIKK